MMAWTDRHCRAFHRTLTRRALVYSEMVTTAAVLNGDRARLLGFDALEQPVALQLGGCEPNALAQAAKVGEDMGYREINLNVGCPSDRVQSGRFGACLMREPELVADCMAAIIAAVSIPATVKCRIGVDDQDAEEGLFGLVDRCAAAGVTTFIVHARKAWLKGLSPKDNRDVPPLDYPLVWRLKAERPKLTIVINGGISTLEDAQRHLDHVDGVMLGRAAYHEPGLLGQVDRRIFGEDCKDVTPFEAVERHQAYLSAALAAGARLPALLQPMIGLFHGWPGARAWRRILTTEAVKPSADLSVVARALTAIGAATSRREASYSAAMT
jgi:tRNA-dihydrouridine synthase A